MYKIFNKKIDFYKLMLIYINYEFRYKLKLCLLYYRLVESNIALNLVAP